MIIIGKDTPANIVIDEKHPPFNPYVTLVMPPAFRFLIDAAIKFATWKFVLVKFQHRDHMDTVQVYPVRVHVFNERGLAAGRIESQSYTFSCDVVEFYNDRISRAIERGTHKRTSKQDVALKLLKKWFVEPPLSERMEVAADRAKSLAGNKFHHIRSVCRQQEATVLSLLSNYVIDNIDTLWPIAVDAQKTMTNAPQLTLESFKSTRDDLGIADSVVNQKTLTLLIEDDKYIVHRGLSPLVVMSSDQLSGEFRRAVGLLKLVEVGQFIRDTGFRAGENVFCVVDSLFEEKEQCKISS